MAAADYVTGVAELTEAPLPDCGPWARRPTPRLGVIGGSELAGRLERMAPTVLIGPRDQASEVAGEVDALLVQWSVFADATSAWAHALRPAGFDRGTALASLLDAARQHGRPVLGIDDRGIGDHEPWHTVLGSALDDVAPLTPVVGAGWNPGLHWSSRALGPGVSTPVALPAAGDRGRWRQDSQGWQIAQQRAVLHGEASFDPDDPWSQHLADELTLLGVPVRCGSDDERGGVLPPRQRLLPSGALEALCSRLDLTPPATLALTLVVATVPTGLQLGDVARELGAGCEVATDFPVEPGPTDIVLLADPEAPLDVIAARHCRDALDRCRDLDMIAASQTVGLRARALQPLLGDRGIDGSVLTRLRDMAPRVPVEDQHLARTTS